jgi:hypothetical protein
MNELLKGRISDTDGLKEVLELVATFKEVGTAVLDIDSEVISGRIGIAWGKFITGALVSEPEQKGKKALRQLLRLRSGKFVFLDLKDELPVLELRQALGIDLMRTIEVVPELDPKEAHFLWAADEVAGAEEDSRTPKATEYIANAELGAEGGEWIEPDEPELLGPEIPELTVYESHDSEPVLPNFEQMSAAVAQNAGSDYEMRVPDISEEEQATAYEIRRLPAKPGFESTAALDAVFGAMPDSIPQFQESTLPKTFGAQRPPSGHYAGVEITSDDRTSAEPWLPPEQPVRNAPMLQPNVVADPKFVGQQYVDPPAKLRPAVAPDSGRVLQIILCIILFVVSCASTVLLGPRAWQFISSVLHH